MHLEAKRFIGQNTSTPTSSLLHPVTEQHLTDINYKNNLKFSVYPCNCFYQIDLGRLVTLIERGADVNFSDREGHTVLHEVKLSSFFINVSNCISKHIFKL